MYVVARASEPEGLGLPWFIPILIAVGGAAGSAVATRFIARPSGPSQKEVEKQLKLQHELEIQRMFQAQQAQQQQVAQLAPLVMPALGIVALVMLLR